MRFVSFLISSAIGPSFVDMHPQVERRVEIGAFRSLERVGEVSNLQGWAGERRNSQQSCVGEYARLQMVTSHDIRIPA